MFEPDTHNYYEILDVKPDATQNEIRQAYFRAKAAYSKDSAALYSLFDEHETRQVLEAIEQAFLVLSNPEKRKEYDRVHGFLKSGDMLPAARRTAPQANVFSFAKTAAESADPAHQAAQNVFGTGVMSDLSTMNESTLGAPAAGTTPPGYAPERPVAGPPGAPGQAPPGGTSPVREERHEDYATPRTLASHGAAGPPVQEYTPGSFSTRENKLGIVRRIELLKAFERNPALEEEISREGIFRGEFFRKVREYKCLSIEELAEFTKISKTYINCIESEEFESLPAPAYLRGFVVQIAKALKLPHEKAASAYMAHYKNTVMK